MNSNASRFSIITATPPGYNPGMLVVELAAQDFLQRHDFLDNSKFFRLVTIERRLVHLSESQQEETTSLSDIGLNFDILETVEQISGTILVYWGDFLHMLQYIRGLANAFISIGRFSDYTEAESFLLERLLLSEAPKELLRDTISFGSSLLFNNMNDSFYCRYWQAFARFSSNIAFFKLRDVFSANYIRGLRPATAAYPLGIDPVQLLNRVRLKNIFDDRTVKTPRLTPAALVFLGRDYHNLDVVRDALRHLENRMSCQFSWLPWGNEPAFPLLPLFLKFAAEFPCAHDLTPTPFFDLLYLVQHASVIVTDTYHLAVIGWSLGTPVICIKGCQSNSQNSVNSGSLFAQRDKRFVFYAQNELLDFFLNTHTIPMPKTLSAWADWVCDLIIAKKYMCRHLERHQDFVDSCESELVCAMYGLL